jgi:hypothetical protein
LNEGPFDPNEDYINTRDTVTTNNTTSEIDLLLMSQKSLDDESISAASSTTITSNPSIKRRASMFDKPITALPISSNNSASNEQGDSENDILTKSKGKILRQESVPIISNMKAKGKGLPPPSVDFLSEMKSKLKLRGEST